MEQRWGCSNGRSYDNYNEYRAAQTEWEQRERLINEQKRANDLTEELLKKSRQDSNYEDYKYDSNKNIEVKPSFLLKNMELISTILCWIILEGIIGYLMFLFNPEITVPIFINTLGIVVFITVIIITILSKFKK